MRPALLNRLLLLLSVVVFFFLQLRLFASQADCSQRISSAEDSQRSIFAATQRELQATVLKLRQQKMDLEDRLSALEEAAQKAKDKEAEDLQRVKEREAELAKCKIRVEECERSSTALKELQQSKEEFRTRKRSVDPKIEGGMRRAERREVPSKMPRPESVSTTELLPGEGEVLKISERDGEVSKVLPADGEAREGKLAGGGGEAEVAEVEKKEEGGGEGRALVESGTGGDVGREKAKVKQQEEVLSVGEAVAAVVVMACNRADYLKRTLQSVLSVNRVPVKFPLFISQDGLNDGVKALAKEFPRFHYLQHIEDKPPVMNSPNENIAYYRIAAHYRFALSQLFDVQNFSRVIILEDDMELAPDFFGYFEATSMLLDVDETLLAVSSWNDNGQTQFVRDSLALYRSDFFPGLGWMLKKELWNELGPKWPKAYWDDWLRLQSTRRGRQTIRPEICRTYNFGEHGSSQGQFYYKFLKPIKLNDVEVNWKERDLSHLLLEEYVKELAERVREAKPLPSTASLTEVEDAGSDVRIPYTNEENFAEVADRFGIFTEWKDGVPRTAFKGAVIFWYKNHRVFLTNDNVKSFAKA